MTDAKKSSKPKPGLKRSIDLPNPQETAAVANVMQRLLGSRSEAPTPVVTPVTTHVTTPAETPVEAPARTAVETPVAAHVEASVRQREAIPAGETLDSTHTASEQQVYSYMYRQTISQGKPERYFGNKELMKATGIRGDHTIRRAIDGLVAKRSIKIVEYKHGDPLGPRYRVFTPKEIFTERRRIGIVIDPQSKKIVTPVETPVATVANLTGVTPVKMTGVFIDHEYKEKSDDDSPLEAGLRSFFPDLRSEEIRLARLEIERIVLEELEQRVEHATTPPVSPQYFVECVRRLCSASNRPEKPKRSRKGREAQRRKIEQIIARVRELNVGTGPEYNAERFRRDVERACGREGVIFDLDLFNEIVAAK